jgi:cation diffusion facilitator family transporter
MGANFALAIIKLVSGIFGHSYALIADAIESLTDIIGSVVIWGGLHISSRPVSDKHPYGYGKAESLAALLVSLILFLAGVGISVEAIREIITPHHTPAPFTLIVLVVVIIVKEVLFRYVRRTAIDDAGEVSTAVKTDAWHHRADAITSIAAFIGISVAVIGKHFTHDERFAPADDYAALIAAAVIMFNAYRLMLVPYRELLDVQPSGLADSARAAAAAVPGVTNIQKVLARKSGTRYWIDMHLWVAPDLTVREAHAISHLVKDAVRAANPSVHEVLIHIEPDGDPDPED